MGRRPVMNDMQRLFIERFAKYCTYQDLAEVTGLKVSAISSYARRCNLRCISKRQTPIAAKAVKRAYKMHEQGHEIDIRVLQMWSRDRKGIRRKIPHKQAPWTDGDVIELLDCIGYEPLADIAHRIGRSESAAFYKLKNIGKLTELRQHSPAKVGARLQMLPRTLKDLCKRGIIRAWMDMGWWTIHADDIDWMEENYQGRKTDWERLRKTWEVKDDG